MSTVSCNNNHLVHCLLASVLGREFRLRTLSRIKTQSFNIALQLCAALQWLVVTVFVAVNLIAIPASAQQPAPVTRPQLTTPDPQQLFEADRDNYKEYTTARRKKILAIEKETNPTVEVKANNLEFLREPQRAHGTGGTVVSRAGVSVQAEDAYVNMDTKDTDLKGDLLIVGMDSEVGGERGVFNLETEKGSFENAAVAMEQGGYNFKGSKIDKISEFTYDLFDARLTTCGCTEGNESWFIDADSAEATQEGYAHVYNATFKLYDVPFFYTPYLAFPVKTERASGLLTPSFNFSNQDGFMYSQPIFAVIDESTDLMLSPFIATNSRWGTQADFRKIFSNYNQVDTRWVYSDETWRGNSPRGIDLNAFDQNQSLIDTNRFGGYYKQSWRGEPEDVVPWAMNSNILYVSDDLLLRELPNNNIGPQFSRFAVSQVSLTGAFGEYVNASLGSEYSQSLSVDQPEDQVLQRLPTTSIGAQKSFRPFGFNPYGLKVNSGVQVNSVDFSRSGGFDGWRHDINPTLRVPFHYANYFDSEFSAGTHQTYYQMDSTFNPKTMEDQDFDTQRSVHQFSNTTRTAIERVYDLDPGNSLTYLTSLGSDSQVFRLERVKHTIEPFVNYLYIPEEDQTLNPLYDQLDRIEKRSLVTYGFRTALLGRFLPPGGVAKADIPELTPRVQDLPLFDAGTTGLPDFGNSRMFNNGGNFNTRNGEIREIASLAIRQNYDFNEVPEDDETPDSSQLSDLHTEIGMSPTSYLGFTLISNYDVQSGDASSWDFGTSFRDDRGDIFALHYQYIGPQYNVNTMSEGETSLNQIEGNIELVLTEQVRLAYYARYDEIDSEIQSSRVALRFSDTCKCWFFDVGYRDQLDPDQQFFTVALTLAGLGALNQSYGLASANGSSQ
jgi:LPS-assembly protein